MSKITSLSINWYGNEPSGSFSFNFEGGYINHNLDKEDCEKIHAIAYACIERKKQTFADQVLNIEAPKVIGYDRTKTIENDSYPF